MSGKEIDYIINFEDNINSEGENEFYESDYDFDFEALIEDVKTACQEMKSYLNFNSILIAEKLNVEHLLDLIERYYLS
jgi:hypothetical protein